MFSSQQCRNCNLLHYALFRNVNKVFSGLKRVSAALEENRRGISTSGALRENNTNYYHTLGLPKNSTQNDIKSAYYKLSMQYHPDKNQGCEDAAKKFRQITQAYEVLGNYRLRRMYDKGIIHTAGSQYAQHAPGYEEEVAQEVEDDAETKFYKSRFKKSQVTDTQGRTPIYNFDEWSKAHYGTSFERKKNAKEKFDRKKAQKRHHIATKQMEVMLFGLVFVGTLIVFVLSSELSYDSPKNKTKNGGENKTS